MIKEQIFALKRARKRKFTDKRHLLNAKISSNIEEQCISLSAKSQIPYES